MALVANELYECQCGQWIPERRGALLKCQVSAQRDT